MINIPSAAGALALLTLSSQCLAAPAANAQWHDPHHWSGPGNHHHPHGGPPPSYGGSSAIYFLRNNPAGSSVVSAALSANGSIEPSSFKSFGTGGVGLLSPNASAPNEAVETDDNLQGQDAVVVAGNYLFTVNAGSKTLATLSINPQDPTDLTLLGSPTNTLGEFPMSVAYSVKYNKVCVLNGGEVNGVACFNFDAGKGLTPDGAGLRNFHLNYTTPPVFMGPRGSASDIRFAPDSSKLVVSTKGTNQPPGETHIFIFDVSDNGDVATKYTDFQTPELVTVFGFTFDDSTPPNIFASDATYGGGLLSFEGGSSSNQLKYIAAANSTKFVASCWAIYARETGKFYNINAGSPNIGVVNAQTGALETIFTYDSSLIGGFDTVVAGTTAWFLAAANTLVTFDLESGQVLQTVDYSTADDRKHWQGIARWPAQPDIIGGL